MTHVAADPVRETAPDPAVAIQRACSCPACTHEAQSKITLGTPGDRYEQEADRIADQVTSDRAVPLAGPLPVTPMIQRQVEEEEEEEMLQPKAQGTGATAGAVQQAAQAVNQGGRPLPASERAYFEPRFGRDLSAVRIHDSAGAAAAAREINARAYTLGSNIAFAPGEFAPQTQAGRHLIAHELTHTLQQRAMPMVVQHEAATPEPRFQDCTPAITGLSLPQADIDMRIAQAISTAEIWARSALAALQQLQGSGAPASLTQALTAHFGPAMRRGNRATLIDRFRRIAGRLAAMNARNLVICNPASNPVYCQDRVWCAFSYCPGAGTLTHLCPRAFRGAAGGCDEPDLESIMLHEAGRIIGLCRPCVQAGTGGYPPARPMQSMENICAYAAFASDARVRAAGGGGT